MKPKMRLRLPKALACIFATLAMLLGLSVTTVRLAGPASATDSATAAANWAYTQIGGTTWDANGGECLMFVSDAYASQNVSIGSADTAVDYWNAHTTGRNSDTNPPVGALVFWGATTASMGHGLIDNPDGHVAISYGNGNVISSKERSNAGVHEFTIASRNTAFYPYLGWMMPPNVSAPSTATRPVASGNVPWNFTVLDGDSGSISHQDGDIGRGAAVTTYNGSQQAFYYDATGGNLRHAWRGSGGSWNVETLDGAGGGSGRMDGNVGVNPSVAVFGDSIQVFYYDATNGNLRHAWASSTVGWQFETLDGDSGAISGASGNVGSTSKVVVDSTGALNIFYPNTDNGDLRRAWSDSTGWHFENLDGDSGSIAGQAGNYGQSLGSSLSAIVVGTDMHVFYYATNGENLRHAWYNASGWHFETLDGDSGAISGYNASVGQNSSVAYNGSLQLFYYDATGASLRHAWTDSTGWHFEEL
ncbi:MAG: hypothetical protein ACQR33_06555, partial [Candidatus Saccharibacteria bacterium]